MLSGMFKERVGKAAVFVTLACAVAVFVSSNHGFPNGRGETQATAENLPGQVLSITAKTTLGRQPFDLEVAQKPQQQSIGLMYRTFLPANRGMLFPFQPAQQVSFWMKHCRISLDMIFLREDKVVAIAAKVPPCVADPCPSYGPKELVDRVIEVGSGRTAELGLKVGDTVKVQWIKKPVS
jgi:uncharacterized protein